MAELNNEPIRYGASHFGRLIIDYTSLIYICFLWLSMCSCDLLQIASFKELVHLWFSKCVDIGLFIVSQYFALNVHGICSNAPFYIFNANNLCHVSFSFTSLARSSLNFSNNHHLVLLIFSIDFLFSMLLISTLFCIIPFLWLL